MSSKRAALPGADELFRRTQAPVRPEPTPIRPAQIAEEPAAESVPNAMEGGVRATTPSPRRRRSSGRPTGRIRHDEKITVYVSPEELVDIENAKLALRATHGLAVDRGRIVREALAVVVADLEQRGEDSIIVRRLRGL